MKISKVYHTVSIVYHILILVNEIIKRSNFPMSNVLLLYPHLLQVHQDPLVQLIFLLPLPIPTPTIIILPRVAYPKVILTTAAVIQYLVFLLYHCQVPETKQILYFLCMSYFITHLWVL